LSIDGDKGCSQRLEAKFGTTLLKQCFEFETSEGGGGSVVRVVCHVVNERLKVGVVLAKGINEEYAEDHIFINFSHPPEAFIEVPNLPCSGRHGGGRLIVDVKSFAEHIDLGMKS